MSEEWYSGKCCSGFPNCNHRPQVGEINEMPRGKHHPFCIYLFQRYKKLYSISGWRCECDVLNAYEIWKPTCRVPDREDIKCILDLERRLFSHDTWLEFKSRVASAIIKYLTERG